MTQDEVARRLGVVGNEVSKITFWPSGSNVDTFNFAVSQKNHGLTFSHGDMTVKVDEFKLVDAEKWMEDEGHRHYPAVHRSGAGLLWYSADIEWQAGKQKGKADNVALGYPLGRDRCLAGLIPNTPSRTVINDLLLYIEQIASGIFEGDLLDKQPAGRERAFVEDRQGGRQWQDKF
jgi:hypothetical protein